MATQLPIRFQRLYAEALDNDYSFTTAQRNAYLGNALRYSGQVVFDNEQDKLYRLNNAKTAWVEIAGGGLVITSTDDVPEGITNKYFTGSRVLATILAGLSTATSTVVTASDSILIGFGKLQAQITTLVNRVQNSMTYDGSGVKIPTVDAVNNQSKQLATVSVHTGFIRTDDSFTLGADLTTGANKLTISASQYGVVFSSYLTTAGTAPIDAVKNLTARVIPLNATNLPVIPNNSSTIKYVGWAMPSDTIVFSDTSYVQSPSICQLGFIFYQNNAGVYEFVSPTRTYINMPDVAAYSNLLTTTATISSNIIVSPVGGNMTMKHTAGSIKGISVNWGMGGNTDERTISAVNPFTFSFRHPGSNSSLTLLSTTVLDPTLYWNGSALVALTANGNAQVMRILMSLRGGLVLQPGEVQYTTLAAAKESAIAQSFTEVIPKGSYVELCRIAIRKDTTNLADLTSCSIIITSSAGGGGGTSASTFSTISGSPYDNTLLSAELIKAIAPSEFTLRTDPDIKTTSDPVAIRGYVNTITALYAASDGSTVPSTNFTYNYRVSTSSSYTTGVNLATLNTALANSSLADKIVWVTATNTTNTVPASVILTVKKYA